MQNIFVIGINHKTAPIDIREKFYLKPIERELLLSELKSNPSCIEAFVISTCNRTEIYARMLGCDVALLWNIFLDIKGMKREAIKEQSFFEYKGIEAIKHLLRVSCGLDSLILGEKQIMGQLREAIDLSRNKAMLSKTFNLLSNIALRTGKKARATTQIDFGGSSVSWAAVVMAQRELSTLQNKSVLIIGAGKMSQLAIRNLKEKGVQDIYVTNRTHDSAIELADEYGVKAVSFWEMLDVLTKVDCCICSASAPHYLIEKDLIVKAMATRADKKLLCIDISMPRNINPNVSEVENVSLIYIDDLDKVLEDTISQRFEAVSAVEQIIQQKVDEFVVKLNKQNAFGSVVNVHQIA